MTTLALVDDHAIFRVGLRNFLAREQGLDVVAEAGEAKGAYQALERTKPDVVVLDIGLPGVNGIAVAREITRLAPQTKILALSIYSDAEHVTRAFEAGMLGYATKAQPAGEVVDAIRTVAQGRRYLAPSFSPALLHEYESHHNSGSLGSPLGALTKRERQIFDLTVRGLPNAAIATELGISRRTVETHRSRILHKLHAHNAMGLVRMAAQLGILEG
jgi:DNA-binding NarL/FixJ family response regulator